MSRKIAFRGGYDNCLGTVLKTKDKRSKVPNYCPVGGLRYRSSEKLPLSEWFSTSREAINFNANTGLYFGIGIFSGRFTLGGEEKTISAPLIIYPAEYGETNDESPNVDVMWEAPQINIDLLAVLLRSNNSDEEDFSFTPGVLSSIIAEKIKEIERLINEASINSHSSDSIKVLAEDVLEIIQSCEIDQIDISERFTYELFTNSREKNASPLFFPEAFYFHYNKPSDVTTFYAINQMINELNLGGVQNQLLGELIESTIEQQVPQLDGFIGAASLVDESIFDYIPLGLSESQQQALLNAWKSPVSYIQGPPGTGKSHTICAIIMSAAVLGKRVLLISNKHAALTVVDDKLKKIIGCECLNFAVRDSRARQEQKSKLQTLQQDLQRSYNNSSLSSFRQISTERTISTVEGELKSLVLRRNQCKKLIGSYLQKCNDAYIASKKFSDSIRSFSEKYGAKYVNQDVISQVSPSPSVVQVAQAIKKLIEDKELNDQSFSCLELLKMSSFRSYISSKLSPVLIEGDSNFYKLTDYVELLQIRDTAELKRKSVPISQQSMRAELNSLNKQIADAGAKLIKLKLDFAKYSKSEKTVQALSALASILHFRNPARLSRLMENNPIAEVTKCLPFWAAEINALSSVFPFKLDMFDLVIVDEASQVNLPEIIPGFYRGTNFCVVGDEKQLGLSAAGFFALNTTFEGLSWNTNCPGISFDVAASRGLIASRHSILDFLLSIDFALPRVTLKEHFRSKPALADFTSEKFYSSEGGLRVMTEVGENVGKVVFYLEQVGGERKDGKKYVQEEINRTVQIIQSILNGEALKAEPFMSAGLPNKPSVGVISFLTEQRDQLRNVVKSKGLEDQFTEANILIGTPEEFQGNERDIIILTFGLADNIKRYAKNFYEEPKRFNVATSRARCFTYAIVGAVPDNAHLLKDYFAHFGYLVNETEVSTHTSSFKFPEFRDDLLESDFERKVADELKDYMRIRNGRGANLKLHNQVVACGEKRLDFVIFNGKSMESLAIEVDGPCHYEENSDRLTESHIRRVDVLKRAGWKILHIEYCLWYKNGWLCDNEKFTEVRARLHADLDNLLSL